MCVAFIASKEMNIWVRVRVRVCVMCVCMCQKKHTSVDGSVACKRINKQLAWQLMDIAQITTIGIDLSLVALLLFSGKRNALVQKKTMRMI